MTASEISDGSKYMRHSMKSNWELEHGMWWLNKRGALKQLEEVLQDYKLDTIVVQEIRWIGQGILEKENYSTTVVKKVNMILDVDS